MDAQQEILQNKLSISKVSCQLLHVHAKQELLNPIVHGLFYVRWLHGGGKNYPQPKRRTNIATALKLCMNIATNK